MPKGISEADVHETADALVEGERPTVERIRAHLGTGSPNTVTRWLEPGSWAWAGRLQAGQRWDVAVSHSHTVATQAHADAKAAVQARAQALATSETQIRHERSAWSEECTALIDARDLAQRGVSDLEAHLQALGRHLDKLQRQHAQVDTERDSLLGQLLAAQAAAQEATAAANAERIEREHAHRAAEDRWM